MLVAGTDVYYEDLPQFPRAGSPRICVSVTTQPYGSTPGNHLVTATKEGMDVVPT